MSKPESTTPFKNFILDVKVCGVDGRTGKTAVLLLFMEGYSEIVFHSMYQAAARFSVASRGLGTPNKTLLKES